MRTHWVAFIIGAAGVLTFGVVFTLLQVRRSDVAPAEPGAVVSATVTPTVVPAGDAVTPGMRAGQIAVGVPSAGSEPLLLSVHRGDRLDVLASLPSPADSRPVTVLVVSGATVLRPGTATDPLLLEVPGPDAIVLAHLILGGTHLAYTVRADGGNPPGQLPLDERTARAVLGLPAISRPDQSAAAAPSPTLPPTVSPRPQTFVVQEGESLYTLANRLRVNAGALWWANRSVADPTVPLTAGTTLQVPQVDGFLYQVQPGDTWDSVAGIFGVPAAELSRRNEMADTASLVSGMLLFIPSGQS